MSWPRARRTGVSACVIFMAGLGPLAAQQPGEKQISDKYLATAELYRKSAAKNVPERRECFLGWAAYYDSLAAAVHDGLAPPPEPNLDPTCPAPGFVSLVSGQSEPAASGPAPTAPPQPLPSPPAVAAVPVESAPPQEAGSADVALAADLAEPMGGAAVPAEEPIPMEAGDAEPQPQVIPQEMPVQSASAALFDGLRYDMSKSSAGSATLSPDVRRKIDALQLIMEDLSAAPANGRAAYLEEFISASAPVVSDPSDNPYKFGILTLRTAAFLELNRADGGREAGGQLLSQGATSSEDTSVRRLMAMLERKGWLAQDTGLWTAPAGGAAATAAAATASLAGSVWSGSLVIKDKNRKEVARYGIDLQFTENGNGTAIYRAFTPAFTWTQVGARSVVKTQIADDCLLSVDITTDGGTQRGAVSWTGTVSPGGRCFQAAGGARSFMPSEFTATRVATQAPQH